MTLKIKLIGVGSAFSRLNDNTCILVEDSGQRMLLDCGHTTGRALAKCGYTFGDIHHIAVTHRHADHVGGLEEAAFYTKFISGNKIVLWGSDMLFLKDLWEKTLRGGLAYDGREKKSNKGFSFEHYFHIGGSIVASLAVKGFAPFKFIPVPHIYPMFSSGILFPDKFFYSGDSKFAPAILERIAPSVKIIFHDCQLFKGGAHASLEELITLPEEIRRKIILVHYGDDWANYAELASRNNMIFGSPGMEFEI